MSAFAAELRLFWFRTLPVSGVRCQPACKPGFVWRAVSRARWPFLWDGRCRPPRATNPGNDPETDPRIPQREKPCVAPIRSCSRWGLPCRSCCHARGALLPHRFTLALRRFVFCGAFPGVAPAGSYPAPCLRGARTFLHCESGGHPAGWPEPHRRPGQFRQLSNGNARVVQMLHGEKFRSKKAISVLTRRTG
jgi:hypothetical protein